LLEKKWVAILSWGDSPAARQCKCYLLHRRSLPNDFKDVVEFEGDAPLLFFIIFKAYKVQSMEYTHLQPAKYLPKRPAEREVFAAGN
jgi:hypothetical protein